MMDPVFPTEFYHHRTGVGTVVGVRFVVLLYHLYTIHVFYVQVTPQHDVCIIILFYDRPRGFIIDTLSSTKK
jgi:hypothetical protein